MPDAAVAPDAAPPPLPRVAQLIVGTPAALLPGDTTVRAVLAIRLADFVIQVRDDSAAADLTNVELVVIAGSVSSESVRNRYRDVAVPVLSLEYTLFDDLGLTGTVQNQDLGGDGRGSQIEILDPAHPLSAGLSGLVSVVSVRSNMAWGNPGPAAARIAGIPGVADRLAIFAYAKGAQMSGLAAPAKRVGFFALETAAARLSDSGARLLGAAIDWALLPD